MATVRSGQATTAERFGWPVPDWAWPDHPHAWSDTAHDSWSGDIPGDSWSGGGFWSGTAHGPWGGASSSSGPMEK